MERNDYVDEVIWFHQREQYHCNDLELGYILSQKKHGVVFLDRQYGIREMDAILCLKKLSGFEIHTVSCKDLVDQIIAPNNDSNTDEDIPFIADFACDVLIIRDIERLRGKTITQMILWQNVKRMAESSLVILTGTTLKERIPYLSSVFLEADYYMAELSCESFIEKTYSQGGKYGRI